MKEWVIERVRLNRSFPNLSEKIRFGLVGRISNQLQKLSENKGQVFFEAYKTVLGPILERVNWIYVKNPDFPYRRWNSIKAEVEKTLRGNDQLVKVPAEVVAHQVGAINKMMESFVDGHQLNRVRKEDEWVKNPMGGWIKKPRTTSL